MADVNISKYRASVVREGSKPATPGFVVSEGQDPVNPPGTNNFVPYSGATSNVELGEFGLESGFVTLDTTPTNTPTDQGTIYWDIARSTAALIMNGTIQHIGQDSFYYVKNSTGSTIAKGVAVRFAGTDGGSGHLLITPFLADGSVPSSYFMGVTAEEITNGSFGQVMHFGELEGVDTSGFTAGDLLYASTTVAGAFQTTAPVGPNNIVLIAAAVNSKNNGAIIVRPTYGSNLNTDEAVKLTSVADKNLLQYQSGTALWENKTLAQVLGGTSAQFVKGDGSLDSSTYGTGTVTSVGLSSATSGVTIGSSPVTTSGTITLAIATASGSQNGLLSSTDWTTFNSKQNALTNPVTGTGTTNYLPKFTGASTIGNSATQTDASGNLGLGVTPSAWGLLTAMQIKGGAFISGYNNNTYVGANWYFDGSVGRYLNNDFATSYIQTDGEHQWLTATSGTAGNAISFTQAMTLTSSSNLLVGTTTDNGARLQVSGTATISSTLTSTDLTIKNSANAETLDLFLSPSTLNGFIDYPSSRSLTIRNKGSLGSLSLASTGAATFSSSVTASTLASRYHTMPSGTGFNAFEMGNDPTAGGWYIYDLTNSQYRITVKNNGLVGIGTASPGQLLTLGGTVSPQLSIVSSTTTGSSEIYFGDSAAVYRGAILYDHTSDYLTLHAGAGERMRITSGGNVLIGTTTDNGNKLQVNGNITVAGTVRFSASGADANRWSVYWNGGTGDLIVVNNISDIRAKKDFDYDIKGLETIQKLKPLKFTWKDGTSHSTSVSGRLRQYGFIAQETMQADDFLAWHNESHDTWGIEQYESFAAVMVKAIQELKQEIDTLKN